MTHLPLLILLPLSVAFVAVVVMALLKSGSDADDAAEEIFDRVNRNLVVKFDANTDEVSAAIDSITRELEQLVYPPTPPRVYRIEPGWWPAVKSNFWRTRAVAENRG